MASAVVTVVAGMGASAVSGAVGAAVGGGIMGAVAGAVAGAVVGGVISAAGAALMGGDIGDAILSGALTGALAGGIAGYTGKSWFSKDESGSQFKTKNTVGNQADTISPQTNTPIVEGATPKAQPLVDNPGAPAAKAASNTQPHVSPSYDYGVNTPKMNIPVGGAEQQSPGLLGKFGEWYDKLGERGQSAFVEGSMKMGGGLLSGIGEQMGVKSQIEAKQKLEDERRARMNNITGLDLSGHHIPKISSFRSKYA